MAIAQTFPVFWWPWRFWGVLGRYFVGCSWPGICLMVFSRLDWVMGLGWPQRGGALPSPTYPVLCHQHAQSLSMLTFIIRGGVFVRLLHCKVTLSPSMLSSLGRSRYAQPTLEGWGIILQHLEGKVQQYFKASPRHRVTSHLNTFLLYSSNDKGF